MGRLKDSVPIVVAAWVAVSMPISLVVGRVLRGRWAPSPPATRAVEPQERTSIVA